MHYMHMPLTVCSRLYLAVDHVHVHVQCPVQYTAVTYSMALRAARNCELVIT